jgi:DeoR/GlpR family transcriptional regulator of sugar metabolism
VSTHRIPAERQHRIQRFAEESGIVSVADLGALLGVSEITVRRDLAVLERRGILERTRGGAICTHQKRVETLFSEKGLNRRAEKQAIGRAAAALIEDGDTVLINGGSTTLEVIRHLGSKRVRLITNNAAAVLEAQKPGLELVLLGGEFRSQSNSVVGEFARTMLQQVYGSKAVIGLDGVSVKHGLTVSIAAEAEVSRHMIERTRGVVIVVADHTKLAAVSNFVSAPADAMDILVTDDGSQQEYREELEQAGIKVVVATATHTGERD